MKNTIKSLPSLIVSVLPILLICSAHAGDGTWVGNGNQTYGNAIWGGIANWSGGAIASVADGVGYTATFGSSFTNGYNCIVNTNRTIGNITYTDPANANNLLLQTDVSNFKLTLNVTSGAPSINVTQAGRTLTINPIILGNDGLAKDGPGNLTLTNANLYTGLTTIHAGTLLVNSPGSLASGSAVAVNGGTLGGTGMIGGAVTVAAAGSLAPGTAASAGTLSIGGNLNISALANGGAGKLQFEIGSIATSDKIAVTGTLTIESGVLGSNDFLFSDLGGLQIGTYTLITTTGGIIGSLDPNNLSGMISSLIGYLQINGNNLEFVSTIFDTDLDGIPDSYELAHTTPPSTTALNPDDDLENGGTGDGLTNLQEYQNGTNPNLKDTDGDGYDDFFEISNSSDPTLDASIPTTITTIRPALEFRFNAANGVSYRIESSTDSTTWNTLETNIIGVRAVVTRFYSTENLPKRYYRVRRN